jgi:alkylation response protein AidB-like acyl-CoA dehydrogenase
MNFDLSDDQLALRDGARDLLDGVADPTRVRAVVEASQGLDADLWVAMAEQGWPGVAIDESLGGLGLGTVEVSVLLEEVGRHAAPAPVSSTVLARGALADAGETTWVERLLAAGSVGCAAWSRQADADGAYGAGLLAVDLEEQGRPEREPAMDRTREVGWLAFEATPATLLGDDGAVDALVNRGATFAAAEMLGGAARALEMAVQYAKDRVQFGRPIGSFQAVKHRCADMLVDVEGMRSTAYWAAWCIGAADPEASIAASTAKVWCSDASKRVMASALQVHGGIGFTWEHDLHLFMKRGQLDQVTFGDAVFHRERLALLLRSRVEAGESVI